jgi:hypothetical protein
MLAPPKPAWAKTRSEVATMCAIVFCRMRPPKSASLPNPTDDFLRFFIGLFAAGYIGH